MLEDAYLPHSEAVEELHRAVVLEADLLGQVGVGGERERGSRLDAELGEAAGRMWESETLPSSPFRLKSSFPVITA